MDTDTEGLVLGSTVNLLTIAAAEEITAKAVRTASVLRIASRTLTDPWTAKPT
jgi:hypothetical protein